MLIPALAALAVTLASAAPCSLAHPQACDDTNQLIWDTGFRKALAGFVGPGRWPDNNEFAAEWIEDLLGGPPEDQVRLANGDLLFSACRAHECDDKAAVILQPGRILGVGVITAGSAKVSLLFRDSRSAAALTGALQEWARTIGENPAAQFQTLARPIRLPPGGDCSLHHLAPCKTAELLNEAADYRAAIVAFVGPGQASVLDLNRTGPALGDFGMTGSALEAVQAALGLVEANPAAQQNSSPKILPDGARLFQGQVFQQSLSAAVIVQGGKVRAIGILNYGYDPPPEPARVDLLFRDSSQAARWTPALEDWADTVIFGPGGAARPGRPGPPPPVFRPFILPLKRPV